MSGGGGGGGGTEQFVIPCFALFPQSPPEIQGSIFLENAGYDTFKSSLEQLGNHPE